MIRMYLILQKLNGAEIYKYGSLLLSIPYKGESRGRGPLCKRACTYTKQIDLVAHVFTVQS